MIKIFENIIQYIINFFSAFKTEPELNPFFTAKYIKELKEQVEGNKSEELKIIDCMVEELREYPILQYVKACLEKEGEVIFIPFMNYNKFSLIKGSENFFQIKNRISIVDEASFLQFD